MDSGEKTTFRRPYQRTPNGKDPSRDDASMSGRVARGPLRGNYRMNDNVRFSNEDQQSGNYFIDSNETIIPNRSLQNIENSRQQSKSPTSRTQKFGDQPHPRSDSQQVIRGNYYFNSQDDDSPSQVSNTAQSLRQDPASVFTRRARDTARSFSRATKNYKSHTSSIESQLNQGNSFVRRAPRSPQSKRYVLDKRIPTIMMYLVIYAVIIFSAWQVLPFNRANRIIVSGNQVLTDDEIRAASKIIPLDHIDRVFNEKEAIERSILEQEPLLETAKLERPDWSQVNIHVSEAQAIAVQGEELVLSNGLLLDESSIQSNELFDELPKLVNFNYKGQRQEIGRALQQIEPGVRQLIDSIYLANDPQQDNRIEVMMKDGNIVKAFLPTFAEKISFYPSFLNQIGNQTGVINIEVGAYFTPDLTTVNIVNNSNN